ncbi:MULTISPECIES: hypothetical protein [unclassified Pseudodesulfovibrio]|uniref:hypothetical protein n=1 Tax=unclassified Pseudodesulfovibrio TaxID=2661612 RepID=UPI0013E308E0|nr:MULTISPECIES: hypothetical protein [unclassified Pseudodesulfovibrio]MCJ2165318.1 hypothetical protein [Pseudodesulfovibrio sp. S3-i]
MAYELKRFVAFAESREAQQKVLKKRGMGVRGKGEKKLFQKFVFSLPPAAGGNP